MRYTPNSVLYTGIYQIPPELYKSNATENLPRELDEDFHLPHVRYRG